MADTIHPGILVLKMKGGSVGVYIESVFAIIPDLNKPKTHSMVYLEGIDDGLPVEGVSTEIIAEWSQKLFWRDAIADYMGAENDDDDSDAKYSE